MPRDHSGSSLRIRGSTRADTGIIYDYPAEGKATEAIQTPEASMKSKQKKKYRWANKHLMYISIIMLVCAVVYYLPVFVGMAGWTSMEISLDKLHNVYGIDILGLVFFAPVVYTSYLMGAIPAIIAAFVAMLFLLPHAILIDTYPNALFKPTAFVIILSAVGSVVAMLQKSEQ